MILLRVRPARHQELKRTSLIAGCRVCKLATICEGVRRDKSDLEALVVFRRLYPLGGLDFMEGRQLQTNSESATFAEADRRDDLHRPKLLRSHRPSVERCDDACHRCNQIDGDPGTFSNLTRKWKIPVDSAKLVANFPASELTQDDVPRRRRLILSYEQVSSKWMAFLGIQGQ